MHIVVLQCILILPALQASEVATRP